MEEKEWKPVDLPFTAKPGPLGSAAVLESSEPVDFLELILTDEFLQMVADQTNLYAAQSIPSIEALSEWTPVNTLELKAFFGLVFLTGLIRKPDIASYWSTDPVTATPHFGRTMSRNRFQLIQRFLHYSDNSVAPTEPDRLRKIRPVLDYLGGKFKELYQPDMNISIDEGALLWRGRLSFKVYSPQKPIHYCIRSYILCSSETGYCYSLRPYCGVHVTLADTVTGLLGDLTGKGYRLFMDNFYNSIKLSEQLLELKTHTCGTLRNNRGAPPSVQNASMSNLGAGARVARHKDGVMTLAWRDNKIVRMVTTFHPDTVSEVLFWQRAQKARVPKEKPTCIIDYNNNMNGVDRLDQSLSYYAFARKSMKWTNKFFMYLLQIGLFNSFVLYRARHPAGQYKTLRLYMESVIRSWTSLADPQNPRRPRLDPVNRLTDSRRSHRPVYLPSTAQKEHPSKRCKVCSEAGLRKETRFQCGTCLMPLCRGICFSRYHEQVIYARPAAAPTAAAPTAAAPTS